jgi:hypothetical protein
MKSIVATVSNNLLGLNTVGEMSRINVSFVPSEIRIKHPMYGLKCANPEMIPKDSGTVLPDDIQCPQDPAKVGSMITTSGVPIVDLLSRFELNDCDFPCTGNLVAIDLVIMERWARMDIESKNGKTLLRFDRDHDYSNIVEVF